MSHETPAEQHLAAFVDFGFWTADFGKPMEPWIGELWNATWQFLRSPKAEEAFAQGAKPIEIYGVPVSAAMTSTGESDVFWWHHPDVLRWANLTCQHCGSKDHRGMACTSRA